LQYRQIIAARDLVEIRSQVEFRRIGTRMQCQNANRDLLAPRWMEGYDPVFIVHPAITPFRNQNIST
jgi:hypothetical protein